MQGGKRKLSQPGGQRKKPRQAKAEPVADPTKPRLAIETFPEQYEEMLKAKVEKVKEMFQDLPGGIPEVEVFESAKEYFRMRTNFVVKHDGERLFYVMFDQGLPVEIKEFPMASLRINELMPRLIEECVKETVLRFQLFEVRFLTTLSGESLITLLYHKKLEDTWIAAAEKLAATLSVKIIGRSKKQKVCVPRDKDEDFVIERLHIGGQELGYQQIEGGFSQPNAGICTKMLEWARKVTSGSRDTDLLELYCGNGNFTLALASNFNRVFATEVSSTSVQACKYNIELNAIQNVKVARLSAEEFTEAWRSSRVFNRLSEVGITNLKKEYNLETILVDPPRAGLDAMTRTLTTQFPNIVYISCNPETLHTDLLEITKTHDIKNFAAFDQFPYTDHCECGVYLTKKIAE